MRRHNQYRGDSPAKKVTRLLFWLMVKELLGDARFINGRYLVLLSREAGDVSVLEALGVPLKNIVGAEWDPSEAKKAKAKFPGLQIVVGDVSKYLVQEYAKVAPMFDAIFLDFCGHTSLAYLHRCYRAADLGLATGGVLGCNLMAEREVGLSSDIRALKKTVRPEENNIYMPRARYTFEYLSERGLMPRFALFYSSRVEDWQGHHWCVTASQKGGRPSTPSYTQVAVSPDEFRRFALQMRKDGENAEMLLNLPHSTLNAWKSHQTRGTYK